MTIYEYSELLDNLSESALAEYEISSILNEATNVKEYKQQRQKEEAEYNRAQKAHEARDKRVQRATMLAPEIETMRQNGASTYEINRMLRANNSIKDVRGYVDAAEARGALKDKAVVKSKNKFVSVLRKIWEFIKSIGRWILDKIAKFINLFRVKTGKLEKPLTISKVFTKTPPHIGKLSEKNAVGVLGTLERYEKALSNTVILKKGDTLPRTVIVSLQAWAKMMSELPAIDDVNPDLKNADALKNCLLIIKAIAAEAQKTTNEIGDAVLDEKGNATGEFKKGNNLTVSRKSSKNESAGDIAYLRAQLLIEAADALADSSDDAGEPLPSVDEYDPEEGFTIAEDEDDITVSDEYVPEVSGGDDEETYPADDDLEELEDLLDDDNDAMDIMTERDGTETIDAEPTVESILNFDFDDTLSEGVHVPKVSSSFSGTDSELEALYDELNDFIEDSKKAAHRSTTAAILLGPLGALNKIINVYKADTRYAKLEKLAGILRKSALKANGKDADKINAIADHIDRICDRRSRKLSAQAF